MMNGRFQARKPLYPVIALNLSIFILVAGLLLAKYSYMIYLLLAVYLLFSISGYHRACLGVLPLIIIMSLIFLLPKISRQNIALEQVIPLIKITATRILAFSLSLIPMMGIVPIELVRAMRELRISKKLILGALIVFNFFPVVKKEIITCKSAVKTRANKKITPPNILYRAYIIPFITSLIKMSEVISMSVETRGFALSHKTKETIFLRPRLSLKDWLFSLFFAVGLGVVIFL